MVRNPRPPLPFLRVLTDLISAAYHGGMVPAQVQVAQR
jgi:hypothetical protein